MGLRQSRLADRYYATREKAFERIEADLRRLQERLSQRQRRRNVLSLWTTAAVVVALAVGFYIIYQVQQQQLPYRQHFERVAGAMALPAAAGLLHWSLLGLVGLLDTRVARKIKSLEDAKRAMIKELKDASSYERTKALIDKYDPDARKVQPAPPPGIMTVRHHAHGQQQGGPWPQSPSARQLGPKQLLPRPGHMAGAAAAAMGSAGMALVPLIDKLATTLIADNPVLVEDLRRAQGQLEEAQRQAQEAARESGALRAENAALKQLVAQLEASLGITPSQNSEPSSGDEGKGQEAAASGLGQGVGPEGEAKQSEGGWVGEGSGVEQQQRQQQVEVQREQVLMASGEGAGELGAGGLRQRRGKGQSEGQGDAMTGLS